MLVSTEPLSHDNLVHWPFFLLGSCCCCTTAYDTHCPERLSLGIICLMCIPPCTVLHAHFVYGSYPESPNKGRRSLCGFRKGQFEGSCVLVSLSWGPFLEKSIRWGWPLPRPPLWTHLQKSRRRAHDFKPEFFSSSYRVGQTHSLLFNTSPQLTHSGQAPSGWSLQMPLDSSTVLLSLLWKGLMV